MLPGLTIVSSAGTLLDQTGTAADRGRSRLGKVKLLVLEFTVMTLGETVPLMVTLVGTPVVSSNNT